MKMKHRTNGLRIDVKPDMARMYASQGWLEVKPAEKKSTAKKAADKPAKGKK